MVYRAVSLSNSLWMFDIADSLKFRKQILSEFFMSYDTTSDIRYSISSHRFLRIYIKTPRWTLSFLLFESIAFDLVNNLSYRSIFQKTTCRQKVEIFYNFSIKFSVLESYSKIEKKYLLFKKKLRVYKISIFLFIYFQ